MKFSIRVKLIVILYGVAFVVAGLVCWIGADIVTKEIERRLVHDSVCNVAGMLEQMRLNPSSGVVTRIAKIVDANLVVVDERSQIVGTSIKQLNDRDKKYVIGLSRNKLGRCIIAQENVFVGRGELTLPNGKHAVLLLLKPAKLIEAARSRTINGLLLGTGATLGMATILILILSFSVTRPLGILTKELDNVSIKIAENGAKALADFTSPRSRSKETYKVANAFDRLLKQLGAAEDRMTRLERLAAIGKVTASVVHEIRNPLSGIKMHLRLLSDEPNASTDAIESLDVMRDELDRLELYVDELVVLAKSGKTTTDLQAESVNLIEEVDYIVRLFRRRTEHAELCIDRRFPANLPKISISRPRLRQLLMNLFINAMEACQSGAVITFFGEILQDGRVRLVVEDLGKGLSDLVGDPFEAFVSDKAHGGGLGLYVCKKISNTYGGEIGFLERERGTAVYVIFMSDTISTG